MKKHYMKAMKSSEMTNIISYMTERNGATLTNSLRCPANANKILPHQYFTHGRNLIAGYSEEVNTMKCHRVDN